MLEPDLLEPCKSQRYQIKDVSFAEPGTAKLRPNNVIHTSKGQENEREMTPSFKLTMPLHFNGPKEISSSISQRMLSRSESLPRLGLKKRICHSPSRHPGRKSIVGTRKAHQKVEAQQNKLWWHSGHSTKITNNSPSCRIN